MKAFRKMLVLFILAALVACSLAVFSLPAVAQGEDKKPGDTTIEEPPSGLELTPNIPDNPEDAINIIKVFIWGLVTGLFSILGIVLLGVIVFSFVQGVLSGGEGKERARKRLIGAGAAFLGVIFAGTGLSLLILYASKPFS